MTASGAQDGGDLRCVLEAHAPEALRPALRACTELTDVLEQRLAAARDTWPGLQLDVQPFVAHVAAKLPPDQDPAQSLRNMHVEDLLLAWAGLRNDARAVAELSGRVLADPRKAQRLLKAGAGFVEDVRQMVCEALFVGSEGGAPALASYSGRGSLDSYIRTMALRIAGNVRRRSNREVIGNGGHGQIDPLSAMVDVELGLIAAHYREHLAAAFAHALASLGPRQRNVLRLSIAEGLRAGEIGRLYGVHRVTVARWLAEIRGGLLAQTRQDLKTQLGAATSEVESLLGLLKSRIDLSLDPLLEGDGDPR